MASFICLSPSACFFLIENRISPLKGRVQLEGLIENGAHFLPLLENIPMAVAEKNLIEQVSMTDS